MPDLLLIFSKKWKLILSITLLATVVAAIVVVFSPKKYLSVATALPSNSVTADKARIFNSNIEALYSEFGTPDELDRIEGTATLDTVFIAVAKELGLAAHYSFSADENGFYKAAKKLKKNSNISRSGYGELKVKAWDQDKIFAATIANSIMNKLQQLHGHLLNEINTSTVDILKKELLLKQQDYIQLSDSSRIGEPNAMKDVIRAKMTGLTEQMLQYEKLIDQYQLAIKTNAPVLLIVENARPALWPDKPKIPETLAFVFFSALLFSLLMALFLESRKYIS